MTGYNTLAHPKYATTITPHTNSPSAMKKESNNTISSRVCPERNPTQEREGERVSRVTSNRLHCCCCVKQKMGVAFGLRICFVFPPFPLFFDLRSPTQLPRCPRGLATRGGIRAPCRAGCWVLVLCSTNSCEKTHPPSICGQLPRFLSR